MVAPNVGSALEAARPFIERQLEVRCVSVDVREVVPGREWNIAVAKPEDQGQDWARADAFGYLLRQVQDRLLNEHPEATDRLYLAFPSASLPWVEGKRWAALGWRAAGGASAYWVVVGNRVTLDLYNHSWTDGQALEMRQPILKLCKKLRKAHPRSWLWNSQNLEAACNLELVEGSVRIASNYWQGLKEIGVFDVNEWAYWMPVA